MARGCWGWTWLVLCQCTSQHSEPVLAAIGSEAGRPAAQTIPDAAVAIIPPSPVADLGPGGAGTAGPMPSHAGTRADTADKDAGVSAADGGGPMATSQDASCLDSPAELDRQGVFQLEARSTHKSAAERSTATGSSCWRQRKLRASI
jgi:hypothetical protein